VNAQQRSVARLVLVAGTVLVVLSEIPDVVEVETLSWITPLDALFRSTSVGGALVLAALGALGCSALLGARERGRGATVYTLLTLVLPLWALQLVVLIAAGVTRRLDTTAPDGAIGGQVWGAVTTFRWNYWVADHVLGVPAEILGLTLFSIAAQLLALLALVIVVVPRRWSASVGAVVAGCSVIVVAALRWRATDFQDPYLLTLDTFSRSDAFFAGVLAVCVTSRGLRLGPAWSSAAALVVTGAVLATGFVSVEQYLAVQLPLVALLCCVMLLDDDPGPGDWLLRSVARSREVDVIASTWAPLVALAPLAAAVIGRRSEMNWVLRVIVLLIVLAIVVRVARGVAGRVRIPEEPIDLAAWGETWRRVVAEADADIHNDRRGRHAAGPDDGRGDSPPR
jgi:hypothetical protein